jgi:integrase
MAKKPDFPLAVRRGSVTVKIYKQTSSNGYDVYTLSYHEDGVRKRPSFADLNEARCKAETIAERLARGEAGNLVLRNAERLEYLRAHEVLDPIGISLDLAANEYAQATNILQGRGSILEAARFFLTSNAGDIAPIQTMDLVNHLIETRTQNHASKRHVQDLRSRLTRFAKAFACDVHKIRSDQIQDFLTKLNLSPRSINNFRTVISNLFSHARLRRHVPNNYDPLAAIPWAEVAEGEVTVYTPDELETMLKHARVEMVPYVVIAAFAGIRQQELAQLDWKDVKADHIIIRAAIAKEGTRRHAPILPNLASWLQRHREHGGRVVPFANVSNQLCKIVKEAGLKSKHNGLRHSYGSYRLAIVKDPAQVAYEMGNSVKMVFQHYRKVVEESEAQRWFGIAPESTCKSEPHPSGAASIGLAA